MTATTAPTAPTAPSATTLTAPARPWWLILINGILALVIGAVLLWAPVKTRVEVYMLLVWFLGFYWLFRGIFDIVYMFIDHTAWGWKLFMGIVGIMAGSYILMYPIASGTRTAQDLRVGAGVLGLDGRYYPPHHGFQGRWLGSWYSRRPVDHLWRHFTRECQRSWHGSILPVGCCLDGRDRRYCLDRASLPRQESLTTNKLLLPDRC